MTAAICILLLYNPCPLTAWQEQGAGNVAELLINGVRVHATATPGSLRKPAEFSFTVSEDALPELQQAGISVRVSRSFGCRLHEANSRL